MNFDIIIKNGTIIDQDSPKGLIKKHGRENLEEVFLKLVREKYESPPARVLLLVGSRPASPRAPRFLVG